MLPLMASARKNYFIDRKFVCVVDEVEGRLVPQNGIVHFFAEQKGIVVPLNFDVRPDLIGEEVSVMIRRYDGELLLQVGEDDVLDEEIDPDREYAIGELADINQLDDILDNKKETLINTSVAIMGMFVVSCIAAALFWCIFDSWIVSAIYGVIGLYLLASIITRFRTLTKSTVYDRVGNWIDLNSGKTSLNGGQFTWLSDIGEDDDYDPEEESKLANFSGQG